MSSRLIPACLKAFVVMLTAGVVLSVAGCTMTPGNGASQKESGTTSVQQYGKAAVFTPSDGITLSQHTPLNKWAKLVPDITDALKSQGFKNADITTKTSDGLDKQSRDIQDYVVKHAVSGKDSGSDGSQEDTDGTAQAITLIVAPAMETSDTTRQYGDYASRPADDGDAAGDDDSDAEQRLVNALQLAKESGMHVVLMANALDGFTPDAFVELSTAQRIGAIQADKLVDKLQLDTISKDNPKAIEILLPYSASTDEDGAEKTEDAAFAKDAFAGAWSVLQPYFKQGKAYSPSGLLTAGTTAAQWRNVAFDAAKDSNITDELDARLSGAKDGEHTRIDGIIAMNDYVASGVTEAFDKLGYTGTAADINPSITLPGIVDNITGKHDLQRGKVPDPIKAPEENAGDDSDSKEAQWPIITGYGAYLDQIPQIVNGRQWMTALENRQRIAEDLAKVTAALNNGESLTGITDLARERYAGASSKKTLVPTIRVDLLAVSASNLKSTMIDTGYISMAEAGL
ncbi:type 1 periplasmic-binding domain-containing protein [Bifidobacterium leontopitheci]|uniref:Periplasmic binding protein domain-containing protein n=1 Tax=Bifidobacterium leontopitheci TaxID=2650774 RepID=A0A6I1GN89_9BIFI|nr:xylose ABC transporter [Bifidobacterium leontopitheci]KAB7791016.1 hypothetical protein F7D09_0562 [Bifidobacterium leontopitheci]